MSLRLLMLKRSKGPSKRVPPPPMNRHRLLPGMSRSPGPDSAPTPARVRSNLRRRWLVETVVPVRVLRPSRVLVASMPANAAAATAAATSRPHATPSAATPASARLCPIVTVPTVQLLRVDVVSPSRHPAMSRAAAGAATSWSVPGGAAQDTWRSGDNVCLSYASSGRGVAAF